MDNSQLVKLEQKEAGREWRYVLMRLLRVVGHFVFLLGLGGVFLGIIFSLQVLPNVLQWTLGGGFGNTSDAVFPNHILLQFFCGLVPTALGFLFITLGPATSIPYMWNTKMPTTHVRVCLTCFHPLPKDEWVIHRCPHCGKWLPIGIKSYLVRLFGKSITFLNLAILLFLTGLLIIR